jgi:hypothetical protein
MILVKQHLLGIRLQWDFAKWPDPGQLPRADLSLLLQPRSITGWRPLGKTAGRRFG